MARSYAIIILILILALPCHAALKIGGTTIESIGSWSGDTSTTALYRHRYNSISGNYIYVAAGNDGLYVVDISDKTAPSESAHVAQSSFRGWAEAEATYNIYSVEPVTIGGVDYLAVGGGDNANSGTANDTGCLFMLNISNLSSITCADTIALTNPNRGIGIIADGTDTLVLSASRDNGLEIFDVSDPTDIPASVGGMPAALRAGGATAWMHGISVNPTTRRCFYPAWGFGFIIVDVDDETACDTTASYLRTTDMPVLWDTDYYGNTVVASGVSGWYADEIDGLYVFDITDITDSVAFVEVTTASRLNADGVANGDYPPFMVSITPDGNYALMGNGDVGLEVFDISTPTSAFHVGTITSTNIVWGAEVVGEYLYVIQHGDYATGNVTAEAGGVTIHDWGMVRRMLESSVSGANGLNYGGAVAQVKSTATGTWDRKLNGLSLYAWDRYQIAGNWANIEDTGYGVWNSTTDTISAHARTLFSAANIGAFRYPAGLTAGGASGFQWSTAMDTGEMAFSINDFINFCTWFDADPVLVMNHNAGEDSNTKYATYVLTTGGHDVNYWEYDCEPYVNSGDGGGYYDASAYAAGYLAMRTAIHAIDATTKLGLALTPYDNYASADDGLDTWNSEVLATVGADVDYVCFTRYQVHPTGAYQGIDDAIDTALGQANVDYVGVSEWNSYPETDNDLWVNAIQCAKILGDMATHASTANIYYATHWNANIWNNGAWSYSEANGAGQYKHNAFVAWGNMYEGTMYDVATYGSSLTGYASTSGGKWSYILINEGTAQTVILMGADVPDTFTLYQSGSTTTLTYDNGITIPADSFVMGYTF